MNIAILGASGKVGRQILQRLYEENKIEGLRLTLIARNTDRIEGAIRDIKSALPLRILTGAARPATINADLSSDYADLKNADMVVMLASAWPTTEQKRRFAEIDNTNRLVQSYLNREMVREISSQIATHAPNALTIMVTNQSDMMTMTAREVLPPHRVLGFGGIIDSSRLRLLLGREGLTDKGHMIGYHNNDMVPMLSSLPAVDKDTLDKITNETRAYGGNVLALQKDTAFPTLDSGSSVLPGYGIYTAIAALTGQIPPIEESFNTVLTDPAVATNYGVPSNSALSIPIRLERGAYRLVSSHCLTPAEQAHMVGAQARLTEQYEMLLSSGAKAERGRSMYQEPARPGAVAG